MSDHRTLHSLSDLRELLPESMRSHQQQMPKRKGHDGKGKTVRVYIDTKGRNGKTMTIVEGLQHNPGTMEEIARILKQHCGAGGTVKDGEIEIQGDQRERASAKLRQMNYLVK